MACWLPGVPDFYGDEAERQYGFAALLHGCAKRLQP